MQMASYARSYRSCVFKQEVSVFWKIMQAPPQKHSPPPLSYPQPQKILSLPKFSIMRKTTFIILFTTMTLFGFSQEDWFGFNRFRADNERITKSGDYPEALSMWTTIRPWRTSMVPSRRNSALTVATPIPTPISSWRSWC